MVRMTATLIAQPFRRIILCTIAVALVTVIVAGGWLLGLQLTGNVHVVDPGHLYRSAQLNGDDLSVVLMRYGIRSIINLRGRNPGEWWYDDELKVSASHGAAHFDVGMGATSEPDARVISRLMKALRTAPRPILVHCASGADRSGLAAALYERFINGQSAEIAAGQLTFRYGHFPWLGSRTIAMDNAFWRLAKTEIQAEGQSSTLPR